MSSDAYAGVMGADYAEGRVSKLHLKWRYRIRAFVTERAFRRINPGLRDVDVLDLGAADGKTLHHLRDLLGGNGRFDGVEYSDELMAAARLPSEITLHKGDVMDLPAHLEEGSYDLVAALAVLEHLPDAAACVREAFRMLKPGGVFVATCPNPLWDHLAGMLNLVEDEHHELEVDRKVMTNWARSVGFADVRDRPFMWVVTGFLPYLGVDVPAELSQRVDELVEKVGLLDFTFVNQMVVAIKPLR